LSANAVFAMCICMFLFYSVLHCADNHITNNITEFLSVIKYANTITYKLTAKLWNVLNCAWL